MKKVRLPILLTSLLTISLATVGFSLWIIPNNIQGFKSDITVEFGDVKDMTFLELKNVQGFKFSDNSFVKTNLETNVEERVDIGTIDIDLNLDYSKITVGARSYLYIDLVYKFKNNQSVFNFYDFTAKDEKGDYFTYSGNKGYGIKSDFNNKKITYNFLLNKSITSMTNYTIELPFIFPNDYAKNLLDISFVITPRVEGLVQ